MIATSRSLAKKLISQAGNITSEVASNAFEVIFWQTYINAARGEAQIGDVVELAKHFKHLPLGKACLRFSISLHSFAVTENTEAFKLAVTRFRAELNELEAAYSLECVVCYLKDWVLAYHN